MIRPTAPHAPRVRLHGRGAHPHQAADGRRLPAVRPVRVQRGGRRPPHRPRPRAHRLLLGEPVRPVASASSGRPTSSSSTTRARWSRATGPSNIAAFAIHSQVHAARPDVHGRRPHPQQARPGLLHARASCSTPSPRTPAPSSRTTGCSTTTPASCIDTEEGKRIAHALGEHKAAILRNHGLLTVGPVGRRGGVAGSSRWSAPARCSSWPRPPARP